MKWHRKEKTTPFDVHITTILDEMERFTPDSEEYSKMLKSVERLTELKAKDKPKPVSRETLATVFGNLAGILLIVSFEQTHVMTSKAINQLRQPK